MDFAADDDHEAIREGVRRACSDFDDDYWRGCDDRHEFPWDFYRAMAEGGWIGIAIPEAYGGGGRGIAEASIVVEEVAASGAAMNGASAIHLSIFGMGPVIHHGSEELRAEVLPAVATGELHVCFGVTEPDAGTDTSRITTRATLAADGSHYLVRGRKVWTTKAPHCQKVLLLTRTTPRDEAARPTDGMTLLLADLRDAVGEVRPEVAITPIPKAGRNAVVSCEVAYDDLPVPVGHRVGDEGHGFRYLLDGLNPERILIAAEALGTGRAALRRAVAYANERIVFDRPIGQNQGIAFPLARAHMQLHAAELAIREAAWRYDHGLPCGEHANTAKYLAAEAGYAAADQAVQTLGGMGYAGEYHVERYWREARLMRLAPVSQELVQSFVATNVLGLPKSY
ncbi:MAG: acyl-CoA/acyl-ACP dehydrogenase [Acidimicrobiales bacterium]|nr:acyl-CoA/acyl-ACP dehydrogenase [Acidimicrobiales bacterium]